MALHGGATLAENELEVRDFEFDDEEEAHAAGHFDSTQQEQEQEREVLTPFASGQNLLSVLRASP
jgi:hypothetical protein